MNKDVTPLEIMTLGRFSISAEGKPVAEEWPDETLKELFCSLLSPLDLYFSWDRICRSMWGIPATRTSRRLLEESLIRPLNRFLIKEFGFNPLIIGYEGIQIDHKNIHIDAVDFHSAVVEGIKLLSLDDRAAAIEKLNQADSLYAGNYLPGMQGKIIANARNDLQALYRSAVMESVHKARVTSSLHH